MAILTFVTFRGLKIVRKSQAKRCAFRPRFAIANFNLLKYGWNQNQQKIFELNFEKQPVWLRICTEHQ